MTSRLLPADVRKEARALAPLWAATAAALAVAALVPDDLVAGLAALAFLTGVIALGAQPMGHEYAHRTLGYLLSQPVSRGRIFVVKHGVAALMILTLGGAAWFAFPRDADLLPQGYPDSTRLLIAAVASGLFVAPWLTTAFRGALAGATLTIALPLLLLVAGDLAGAAIYGIGNAAPIDRFKNAVLTWGLLWSCGVAAPAAWWWFVRAPALDDTPRVLVLPRWRHRRTELRTSSPVWLIIKKELSLQHLAFVGVAVFLVGWAVLSGAGILDVPLTVVAAGYAMLLAIIVGAASCAEERQLGTLEWQMLLPVAAWIQWTIKVTVVLGLTLAAVVGLPALVNIGPRSLPRSELVRGALELSPLALALAAIGLYVSSACSTSLRALVYAFSVAVAANLWVVLAANSLYTAFGPFERLLWLPAVVGAWVHLLGPIGFALLLAWLAFQNHRSQERSARRICLHAVVVAFYLAVVIVPQMLGIL